MTATVPPEEQRFVDAAAGEPTSLLGSTCGTCIRTHFPTVADCPVCGGEVRETRLSHGRLSALTTVTASPPGALVEPPYSVGIADFRGGIRIIGLVDGEAIIDDEIDVIVYEFTPRRNTFAFRRRSS